MKPNGEKSNVNKLIDTHSMQNRETVQNNFKIIF